MDARRLVRSNLRASGAGLATVADLALPDEFESRAADRALRAGFYEQMRIVVAAPGAASPEPAPPRVDDPPAELRSYRAAIAGESGRSAVVDHPATAPPPGPLRDVAVAVARRLAPDGLLRTTAEAIAMLGPARFKSAAADELRLLASVGLPVDLLAMFSPKGAVVLADRVAAAERIVAFIAERAAPPAGTNILDREVTFDPVASHPEFVPTDEAGSATPQMVRLQLPRATYFRSRGDGGAVDLASEVLAAFPDVRAEVCLDPRAAREPVAWPASWRDRVRFHNSSGLPLSQWAADNGKSGSIPDAGTTRVAAILAPRAASRGEEVSKPVAGDHAILSVLAGQGVAVAQSPLLFQGGNVLVVEQPDKGRLLLLGEAEVARNVALGLSRDQALGLFASEFGARRCVVLPAVSNHIDYEICVRVLGDGRTIALVNDTAAAVWVILRIGAESLARGGWCTAAEASDISSALAGRSLRRVLDMFAAVFARHGWSSHLPEAVATGFAGPADSGIANVQRFLLSIDWLAAQCWTDAELAAATDYGELLRSFRRRDADRRKLCSTLAGLGWKVVAVPSTAEAERSANAINAVAVSGKHLYPAIGGVMSPLDELAGEAIARALGAGVRCAPITASESQCRDGGVHCSISVFSHPAATEAGRAESPE